MTTTTDNSYLISNSHIKESADPYKMYEWTWIMFVDAKVTNDKDVPLIEIYKYIGRSGSMQTKSKLVSADEARAEWKFWIGQGFQRITNKMNKGWIYTGDIRKRTGIEKMAGSIKIKPMEKEIA